MLKSLSRKGQHKVAEDMINPQLSNSKK